MSPSGRVGSQRASGERIEDAVDVHDVLERVASLQISSWSYLWDKGAVRHIGPMAQDFYAAFGVGVDDRHINPADGHGVAFAAIQALYELLRRQASELAELRDRLDRLAPSDGTD